MPSNHNKDSLFLEGRHESLKFSTESCSSFAIPSQKDSVDPDLPMVVQETVGQRSSLVNETGDTFEAGMDPIDKRSLAQQEAKENGRK